ncbi:MAG: DEAD/DEAH box helicase [Bacteroides sp.]|nr:DEAD/DEAH box helicase [Bacteroides sp.]
MKEIRFALGYMPHRLWGNILQALYIEKDSGREFFTSKEFIQNDESTAAFKRLTPMQAEVVRLIDSYSDRAIHKLFAKKGTVKEFQDKVTPEIIKDYVRPHIEKVLHEILEIARDNRLQVYLKDKSNRNVFAEDFLTIEKQAADPFFSFSYGEELSYSLQIRHQGKRLNILEESVEVVSNFPAVIIMGNKLYFLDKIDAKKLRPFLIREQVVIPQESEKKYLSSFVKNCIRDFNAEVVGIEMIDVNANKRAEMVLELGLNGGPVWILEFHYMQQVIHANSAVHRFVNYTGTGKVHSFESFTRDLEWEEEILKQVKEVGLRSRDDINFYLNDNFNIGAEIDLYSGIQFVNEYENNLQEAGISLRHRLQRAFYLGEIKLELESEEKEDWFDVKAVVRFGDYTIPFLKLKSHLIQGNREFELPNGEVAILPEEWFARYRSMFEFGKIEGDRILIHKQHFSMMDGSVRDFHPDTLERLEKLKEVESIPSVVIPEGLKADMRPYQVEGFTWLCFLQQNGFGGCLADDMGLGKTLQAIAVLLRSKNEGPVPQSKVLPKKPSGQLPIFQDEERKRTSLVVVPASLVHNWVRECMRFAPGFKVCAHVGNQRNRELSNFGYYDVVVSTYHTVRQDIEQLSKYHFHYVILDESQTIKNPTSKLYQAIIDLESDHRIVLTGTPIENSLTDLWSQINFVNPGLLGTLSFFKKGFVYPIERKKDEQREEKLKELIKPFILRRSKQEVALELPPVSEQVRYCSMAEAQRRIYEEEKSLVRNSILENLEEDGLGSSSIMVLQALTRLRQIANHPDMTEDHSGIDSGKFAEVCRAVESVVSEGHKVLMFSSFVKHLELFRTHFDSLGISYAWLTGSQTQDQRKEAVQTFQKKSSCSLFLISLKAGGVGLNLTAADYVFILDPWWNPAAELQALNRAHRIGQDKRVFVYRFISSDTIEEKIQRLQSRKRELAETFVSSNNPLSELSKEELLELFN